MQKPHWNKVSIIHNFFLPQNQLEIIHILEMEK